MAEPHPNIVGISAALRSLVKPVTMFSDAFDFLRDRDHDATPISTVVETREAINAMRHAAARLTAAADQVIAAPPPPPISSIHDDIERATDEAARFDD